jgi:hypothetical protein
MVVGCDDETDSTVLGNGGTTATGSGVGGGSGGAGNLGGGSTTTGTATVTGTGGAGPVGGAGGLGGSGAVGGAGGQLPNTPGTITIEVSGRSGDDGKRLIASVLTATGTTALGGICETINGGSASGVVSSFNGVDSCDLGSAVTFNPDTYPIRAGIYPSGASMPELCSARNVTVGGDVTVQLTTWGSCN